jgi:nicotinamidase-related amidase
MSKRTLIRNKTALVVIDIQEAFRKSIPTIDKVIVNTSIAMRGFDMLNVPVVVTEQYPAGLGHTVSELKESCPSARYFEKSHFSACGNGLFGDFLKQKEISHVVIAGIETHVCVNQTVDDLLDMGLQVHVLEDAVASRKSSDRKTALKKMYSGGAVPATMEMALFELLTDSKSPDFKQIQALIK